MQDTLSGHAVHYVRGNGTRHKHAVIPITVGTRRHTGSSLRCPAPSHYSEHGTPYPTGPTYVVLQTVPSVRFWHTQFVTHSYADGRATLPVSELAGCAAVTLPWQHTDTHWIMNLFCWLQRQALRNCCV